ncbi:MAG TPA: acyl-CoA synthetase [Sphingomonas sp.]|jgi:long-chain acyl-CoA synthetase|uniref:acyl-CoA synthetase n=1 Tax=Sphingomonas sp. TaxID=28214 RepID=UPI002ED9ED60
MSAEPHPEEPLPHPVGHARATPDKPAYVMAATGEVVTYAELDARADRGARLIRSMGLGLGDGVAVLMDNSPRFLEVMWAAERTGVYCTCLSSKLAPAEAEYIIRDAGCGMLIASAGVAGLAEALRPALGDMPLFLCDGTAEGYRSYEEARDAQPAGPIDDPVAGQIMLYSSGTTGKPKGVKFPLPVEPFGTNVSPLVMLGRALYGFTPDMVYLSPAPLYHAAPLRWSMAVQQLGGTVVVMDRFDPEAALAAIERFRVTHAQWVPTHFVRLLKLPETVRARHDLSSLQAVWHAAAPCPQPVKRAMIDWWGPIVGEYYAGTEGNGFCAISAAEWLARPGSVGRNLTARTMICGDDGEPLPPRAEGTVYFAGGGEFTYHNDPAKTAEAANRHGWTTLGDVGWVDEDGYLYLTDRKSFMIISGGVNIYPAEIESLLVTHPDVVDVAVIGAPHEEMGEEVVAIVQPRDPDAAGPELAAELIAFVRANLSHVKAPRRVDFRHELPRHDTGKLYKRLLRDEYWGKVPA